MDWKYCPYCAGTLKYTGKTVQLCSDCGKLHYQNPKSTVGIFLFDADKKLVLSIRGVAPYKGMQDTIGGFVDIGESLEQGLFRELLEETRLTSADITQPVYLSSEYLVLPSMGYDTPLDSIIFTADIINDQFEANDDVAGFVRLGKNEIDPSKLAFPDQLTQLIVKAFAYKGL